MAATIVPRLGRLAAHETALFVCDVQEKFKPLIHKMPQLIVNTKTMIQCAKTLQVPVFITEQYPKGLGKTVTDIDVAPHFVFEKTLFSMLVPAVEQKLNSFPRLEAHVCVQQTCIDLIDKGYEVHVLADAVSSQDPQDRQFAFERLRQSGAYITTSESALFMMLQSKDHPHFKAVSLALKERREALSAAEKDSSVNKL